MNDLPLHLENQIDMYADDSSIHVCGKSVEEIQENLNIDLQRLHGWSHVNKMAINTDKTKSMLITSNQKRRHLRTPNLNCYLNGKSLENVTCEKLLGVKVDQALS